MFYLSFLGLAIEDDPLAEFTLLLQYIYLLPPPILVGLLDGQSKPMVAFLTLMYVFSFMLDVQQNHHVWSWLTLTCSALSRGWVAVTLDCSCWCFFVQYLVLSMDGLGAYMASIEAF